MFGNNNKNNPFKRPRMPTADDSNPSDWNNSNRQNNTGFNNTGFNTEFVNRNASTNRFAERSGLGAFPSTHSRSIFHNNTRIEAQVEEPDPAALDTIKHQDDNRHREQIHAINANKELNRLIVDDNHDQREHERKINANNNFAQNAQAMTEFNRQQHEFQLRRQQIKINQLPTLTQFPTTPQVYNYFKNLCNILFDINIDDFQSDFGNRYGLIAKSNEFVEPNHIPQYKHSVLFIGVESFIKSLPYLTIVYQGNNRQPTTYKYGKGWFSREIFCPNYPNILLVRFSLDATIGEIGKMTDFIGEPSCLAKTYYKVCNIE